MMVLVPCSRARVISLQTYTALTHRAVHTHLCVASMCPTMYSKPCGVSVTSTLTTTHTALMPAHPACSICPTMCSNLAWSAWRVQRPPYSHRTHLHPVCSVCSTICPTMCPTLRQQLGTYNDHGPNRKDLVRQIPVRGIRDVTPPFISCVSLDRTDGDFESNLASLKLVEGRDYFLFG